MNLSVLKPGEKGRIKRLESTICPMRRRLMDMGVIPGEQIRMEKVAPMGDPIEIKSIYSYRCIKFML